MIIKGKFNLKEEVSQEARDFLREMLEKDPENRAKINDLLKHPWLSDTPETEDIFNEHEKQIIQNEYTYNDASRFFKNNEHFTE